MDALHCAARINVIFFNMPLPHTYTLLLYSKDHGGLNSLTKISIINKPYNTFMAVLLIKIKLKSIFRVAKLFQYVATEF